MQKRYQPSRLSLITAARKDFSERRRTEKEDVFELQKLANLYAQRGQFREAAEVFEKASQIYPSVEFFLNSGLARFEAHDLINSIQNFKKCIKFDKTFRECHIKAAMVYRDLEQFENVQKHLRFAIKLQPNNPDAYLYLGDTLNNRKFFKEAADVYNKGIQISPNNPLLYNSLGDVYMNLKQYLNALHSYKQSKVSYLSILKTDKKLQNNEMLANSIIGSTFSGLEMAYWSKIESNIQDIYSITKASLKHNVPSPLSPYKMLFLSAPLDLVRHVSSSWSNRLVHDEVKLNLTTRSSNRVVQLPWFSPPNESVRPIRIGYLSRRFEDYPGTQMMLRIFSRHNRSRVRVHSFANGPDDQSVYREVIAHESDVFEDISMLSAADASDVVKGHSLDILVDYDGLHDYNSMKLLSYNVAPIQVTWLGFPSTTGQSRLGNPLRGGLSNKAQQRSNRRSSVMGTMLADRFIVAPDVNAAYFTEQMVLVPGSYQPQDECQGARSDTDASCASFPALHKSRAELIQHRLLFMESNVNSFSKMNFSRHFAINQLTSISHNNDQLEISPLRIASSYWLICFSRLSKVSPDVFTDWMQVMAEDGGNAVLLLMAETAEAELNLMRQSLYWGVSSSRLIFLNRLPHSSYKRLLQLSDLFLDTRYYGAHTVSSDAMHGSLPVITTPGSSFASRVAYSLNSVSGLQNELVVYSSKEYVQTILRFIANTLLHRGIRRKVSMALGKCIFNSMDFSRKMERVFSSLLEPAIGVKHIFFDCSQRRYCTC